MGTLKMSISFIANALANHLRVVRAHDFRLHGEEFFWLYRSYYADLDLTCSETLAKQRFKPKAHSC
jgi:hypothetical protein